MIVGAGIVSLLVEIVKNQRRDRIPVRNEGKDCFLLLT